MPRAVILTALPVEYSAVRTHLIDLREETHPQGTIYERGKFVASEQVWEVGIAEIGAGNAGAAVEAERAIAYFKPDILFFVGIAGGIKDVEIGDVVVATKVYGYESGKSGDQFLTRPALGQSAYALVQRAKQEGRKADWLQRLLNSPVSQPRVFVAPIAAGEEVVVSKHSDVFQLLRQSYNDAIAVEMEGFGFLSAAFAYPSIKAIVIRGISDLIEGKNDDSPESGQEPEQIRQKKASHHASAFAFQLLAEFRLIDKSSESDSAVVGRKDETKWLIRCLKDESVRLITIHGTGGIGKTKFCHSVINQLEEIQSKNKSNLVIFEKVVFESIQKELNTPRIFQSLLRTIPENRAEKLQYYFFQDPEISNRKRAEKLLVEVKEKILLVLDDFEKIFNPNSQEIEEPELREFLYVILGSATEHNIKVLILSKFPLGNLHLVNIERQEQRRLEGILSPYAENYLRSLDSDGKAGLKDEKEDILQEACRRLEYNPGALRKLAGYCRRFPILPLANILDSNKDCSFDKLVENLIDFDRLDDISKKILQVLGVFNAPMQQSIIDYLLSPYLSKNNSKTVLNELVSLNIVEFFKASKHYFLSDLTRRCVLSYLEQGTSSDIDQAPLPFTKRVLLYLVAFSLNHLRTGDNTASPTIQLEIALMEFERWYEGEEYDNAALVLVEFIDPLLINQLGYYQLAVDLHERLIAYLVGSPKQSLSLNNLGVAYLELGRFSEALSCSERALDTADDGYSKALALGNKGLYYDNLGYIDEAIEQYRRAIEVIQSHEVFDERESKKGIWLSNIGVCYEYLGHYEEATLHHEAAATIAASIENCEGQIQCFGNLGDIYTVLGDFLSAEKSYQSAIDTIQDCSGSQVDRGLILSWWAEGLIDQERCEQALNFAYEGASIGKRISSSKLESLSNCAIARAYLYCGDLDKAYDAIQNACLSDFQLNNNYAFTLRGLIEMRKGLPARESLRTAIKQATGLLKLNPSRYKVSAYQGLAWCGLTLCNSYDCTEEAKKAFDFALKNNQAHGFFKRILRLLDEFTLGTQKGDLYEVRAILEDKLFNVVTNIHQS